MPLLWSADFFEINFFQKIILGTLSVSFFFMTICLGPNCLQTGFPKALEIMENLENHKKKVPCVEKSWSLKKTLNNHGKSWNFVK